MGRCSIGKKAIECSACSCPVSGWVAKPEPEAQASHRELSPTAGLHDSSRLCCSDLQANGSSPNSPNTGFGALVGCQDIKLPPRSEWWVHEQAGSVAERAYRLKCQTGSCDSFAWHEGCQLPMWTFCFVACTLRGEPGSGCLWCQEASQRRMEALEAWISWGALFHYYPTPS